MLATVTRTVAVVLGIALTAAYAFSLYLLTFGYCYMHEVSCGRGWIARTLATMAYLAVVGATNSVTRWVLRAIERREADQRAGIL